MTRVIGDGEARDLSRRLAAHLGAFRPDVVAYIEEGGATVGRTVAEELGVPAVGVDASYPMSRPLGRLPGPARLALWPLKELVYRLGRPRGAAAIPPELAAAQRLALVDDSASTGRTLALVLASLERAGIERSRVIVGVVRCGRRARPLVDHFEVGEPAIFSRV